MIELVFFSNLIIINSHNIHETKE